MNAIGSWIRRLEAEIARELGQPVEVSAGGEGAEEARCFIEVLETPGASLVLAADREDVARLLVEARVIEAGSADGELLHDLWAGILGSVAARMGGTLGSAAAAFPGHPCSLRLGEATVRLALEVAEKHTEPGKSQEERDTDGTRSGGAGAAKENGEDPFERLLEVELDAMVRFGARALELRELLELGPGDVVELDRQVTDPVDLIVGNKIVARGEVVLVDGNFGLRVTEVAEPVRRLESIRWSG